MNLADIYGAYASIYSASIYSESNALESALEHFQKQSDFTQIAFDKGLICRPHVREALAFGGLAKYEEAEAYYWKCLEAWKNCPGDSDMYKTHLVNCLAFLGKVDVAEKLARSIITSREKLYGKEDSKSFR